MKYLLLLFLTSVHLYSWNIDSIKPPEGWKVELYASDLEQPRGLTADNSGNIFTGSKSGSIYKIDRNRKVETIIKGLNGPIGLDFHNGDLYISEIGRVIVFREVNSQKRPYKFKTVIDNLPEASWHGWKYIKIGPDNKLYINIGAPCNTCLKEDRRYGTISRVDLDGSNFEIYIEGVRNSVGFDWHPLTGELWFTDNGPDGFGDNLPPDELNRVTQKGEHFGFPHIHGSSTKDPKFYKEIEFSKPVVNLPAHVAPLGMRFFNGTILIAEHGSWNRSKKTGYRVSQIDLDSDMEYTIFAKGWLVGETHYGRPADIEILSDNSIVVSDDFNGNIYRFYKDF